ncbi:MAG: choice-of-anchor J domain-containing protein, partial [Duncaniella sp.]|nr:choice-of-anchor J domain-containing protein [Duncaniella sp.]
MKRLIISGIILASISTAEALTPTAKIATDDVVISTANGKCVTHIGKIDAPANRINNLSVRSSESTAKKGYVLYENFSEWNETSKYWVPDGWSVEHRGECTREYTWTPLKPTIYYPTIADGDYCYCISFDDNRQDEWLISPEFKPEKNMILSYYMRIYPLYFYDTKNLNHVTGEYDGGKKILYTVQVLIQEEGGEWDLLRDYAEDYKDYTYNELRSAGNGTALEKQTIDIDDYIGKNVRIAFRYLGADGDLIMLDAIGVGYPTLDNVWYMEPTNSLYWGLSSSSELLEMPIDIAYYPANTPITVSYKHIRAHEPSL